MLSATTIAGVTACCYGSLLVVAAITLLACLACIAANVRASAALGRAERVSDIIDLVQWSPRPLVLRSPSCTAPSRGWTMLAAFLLLFLPAITATAAGASDLRSSIEHPVEHANPCRVSKAPVDHPLPVRPSQPKHWAITGSQRRSRKGALARVPRSRRSPGTGSQGATTSPSTGFPTTWWSRDGSLPRQVNEFASIWKLHEPVPPRPTQLSDDVLRWTLGATYELLRDAAAEAGREACLAAAESHLKMLAWTARDPAATRLAELARLIRDRLHEPRLAGDCDAALIAVAKLRLAWGNPVTDRS